MIQREEDFTTLIQQVVSSKTTPEANLASSSSWSRLKDPRIVRVSRLFGGKDRHSKVSTVKGLRDRRVRLSVPTAIQLYDLQDRLGLNQPSKVVDWLLNAAKNEIDELPPLQMPHGLSFTTQSPSFLDFGASSHSDKLLQGLKISCGLNERSSGRRDENWETNEDENQYFASSSISPNNPVFRWDPSKLTLSQPTQSHGLSTDGANEDLHNFSQLPKSSTLSFTSGSQLLMYHQPEMATQSYFPSQMNTEFDPNYQLSVNSSSAHSVRPFHFSMTENLLSSRNNQQNNNNLEFHDSR